MRKLTKTVGKAGAVVFAWLLAGAVSAQTGSDAATSTPGVPNTGGGDIVANLLLVGVSAAVVLAGIFFLTRPGTEQA